MQAVAKHIYFSGRVQGVGFRFTAQRIAIRFELSGYVRNMPDGRVEMLAQGSADDIKACLEDINETFGHYINNTDIRDVPAESQHNGFEIAF